jgi:ankyrin repeat protein
VAKSKTDKSVRESALMVLRDLNVTDAVFDEAIAIANADPSEAESSVRFRGELLKNWKESRGDTSLPVAATAIADKELAALALLKRRGVRPIPSSLGEAAEHGKAEVVEALLDTGISANAPQMTGSPLGAAVSCYDDVPAEKRIATIDLLLARGADLHWKDGNDNTILLFAVDCPVPVIERLIAAGADFRAKNVMDMTPLKIAFAKGQWSVAEALVAHGARMSRKEIDQLFFEKPDDPAKLALIKRATAK